MHSSLTCAHFQFDRSRTANESRAGILAGLAHVGYRIGKDIKIAYMRADGDMEKAEQIAAKLAKKKYSLIIAIGEPMAQALHQQLDGRVPLVYTDVPNPVLAGLSDEKGMGLGPVTGFSNAVPLTGLLKSVSLMQPEAQKIGLLFRQGDDQLKAFLAFAEAMGMAVEHAAIADPATLPQEAEKLLPNNDLLLLGFDPENDEAVAALTAAALKAGKPVYTLRRTQLEQGAAVACVTDAWRQGNDAGIVAARILSGEDAAAIPFDTPYAVDTVFQNEVVETLGIRTPEDAKSQFD